MVEAIRESLSSGDVATAERNTHSLKGAAGTLGAMAVSAVAANAEAAIRTGQDIDPALAALSNALEAAIDAIRAALPEEDSVNKGGSASADPETVTESLTRLRHLLESNDAEASDFIIEASPHLSGTLTGTEIENLNELIGEFNFDAALECLSAISSRVERDVETK